MKELIPLIPVQRTWYLLYGLSYDVAKIFHAEVSSGVSVGGTEATRLKLFYEGNSTDLTLTNLHGVPLHTIIYCNDLILYRVAVSTTATNADWKKLTPASL